MVSLRRPRLAIAVIMAGGGFLLATTSLLDASLHRSVFLSGWLLSAATVLAWMGSRALPAAGSSGARRYLVGAGLGLALLLAHSGLSWPTGPFEQLLQALALGVATSGIAGVVVAHRLRSDADDAAGRRRWVRRQRFLLFVHVPLLTALVPLGLLHGVLSHAHGWLSHATGIAGS